MDLINTVMPEFKRMHDMTVEHAHEEIQLLANDFSTMLFETTYYLPSFAAYYKSHDQGRPTPISSAACRPCSSCGVRIGGC